jgi:hypothetical protein
MRKVDLKRTKSLLKGVLMGFAVMAATLLLLTNCGSAKTAGSTTGNVAISEYQLSDDCALLHFYRPATKIGVAVSFGVHLDDEVVFLAKYRSKTTVRVTGEGLKTLWAVTESRAELPVDVKLGQEYFIRCRLGVGVFVGRPSMTLMDNNEGRKQFIKIPSR